MVCLKKHVNTEIVWEEMRAIVEQENRYSSHDGLHEKVDLFTLNINQKLQ